MSASLLKVGDAHPWKALLQAAVGAERKMERKTPSLLSQSEQVMILFGLEVGGVSDLDLGIVDGLGGLPFSP